MAFPRLETDRLILRGFELADAADVQRLAGEFAVADTTGTIPHPYPDGVAEHWIATHADAFARGEGVSFAVTIADSGELIGSMSLMRISKRHASAELGFWIGKPFWNRGFCTEAAEAVVRYGFAELGLNRIDARHFSRIPASGAVLRRIGMQREGLARQALCRWEKFEDTELYARLRSDST
ncbi:MAG: GNAT family N-acetyltransferase [Planctomycetota bacterium]